MDDKDESKDKSDDSKDELKNKTMDELKGKFKKFREKAKEKLSPGSSIDLRGEKLGKDSFSWLYLKDNRLYLVGILVTLVLFIIVIIVIATGTWETDSYFANFVIFMSLFATPFIAGLFAHATVAYMVRD